MVQRADRVATALRKEISDLLMEGVKDHRVVGHLISVTDVEVTPDLRYVKAFVSVLGSDDERADIMAGLKAASGYIRSELGRRVRLRHTPELRFESDTSIEKGVSVLSLIDKVREEDRKRGATLD